MSGYCPRWVKVPVWPISQDDKDDDVLRIHRGNGSVGGGSLITNPSAFTSGIHRPDLRMWSKCGLWERRTAYGLPVPYCHSRISYHRALAIPEQGHRSEVAKTTPIHGYQITARPRQTSAIRTTSCPLKCVRFVKHADY